MYTNIASLMAKLNDFSMEIANSKPNIIALTETWLNSDISNNMIALNNYKLFRKDRINGRGGGVCIQADSRSPFIRNFLISQNHINMKIGSMYT
jgi:hypothetical protein